MSCKELFDGTPVPEDLRSVMGEIDLFVMEAGRAAAALRTLADLLADEDEPVSDADRPGLCAAVSIIGGHVEMFATDRRGMWESIARDRASRPAPRANKRASQ